MPQKIPSLVLFAVIGLVHSQTKLTTTGCIDVSGLQQCQNAADASTSQCIAQANADGSQFELLACGCVDYTLNYNCYATHCWNRVNECEYQAYVIEYLSQCLSAKLPVPYFPAPDNAADSCSCNIGNVRLAIDGSIDETATCTGNVNSIQETQGCFCCELSSALSSMYALCPTTDPTLIGLSLIQQTETDSNTPFDSCGPYLSAFNCTSDLGYAQIPGNTFYDPSNLPLTGTATLSNLPGTVTAPASGAVFTYTNGGDGLVYTISAADFNAGSGGTGSGSGSAPTATTQATSSKSSGGRRSINPGPFSLIFVSYFTSTMV